MITNTKRHAMIAQALIVFERSKSEMRFSVAPVGSSSMYACKSGDRRWPKPACWIFSGRRCRCSTTPFEFAAASSTNLSGSRRYLCVVRTSTGEDLHAIEPNV